MNMLIFPIPSKFIRTRTFLKLHLNDKNFILMVKFQLPKPVGKIFGGITNILLDG